MTPSKETHTSQAEECRTRREEDSTTRQAAESNSPMPMAEDCTTCHLTAGRSNCPLSLTKVAANKS
jgi:hypothetical protein